MDLFQPRHELLEPRDVPLGGPRGLHVRRTLPHREVRTVGAWCFADHYGPVPQEPGRRGTGMDVGPHPHTGLQTVSWLLEGELHHLDSLGTSLHVRPGALSLMTAGRGIAHSEESRRDASPVLHGVQLWVALPDRARHVQPATEHHDDLPTGDLGDARVTVVVGSVDGARSPATTFSPLVGADVDLPSGGRAVVPLDPAFEHAVLVTVGDRVVVDGVPVPRGALLHLGGGRRDVEVAADGGGRLLLLGGEPLEEQLLMWWNFVAREHEEVAAAREDWESGSDRFPAAFGDLPRIPAPPLPPVRLRARSGRVRATGA